MVRSESVSWETDGIGASRVAEETAHQIVGFLLDGVHVELEGLTGSGRSWIAKQVGKMLSAHPIEVITLDGIPMPAARRPAAGMWGVRDNGTENKTANKTAKGLAERLGSGPAIIIVDDADWLDEPSIQAVMLATRHTDVTLLSVVQPSSVAAGKSLAPYLSPTVRIAVASWRPEEIDQLLRNQIEVSLEPTSLGLVANAGGGLPGISVALVRAIKHRRGGLINAGNRWRINGPVWSSSVAPTIEALLVGLSDTSLQALQILAVVDSLSISRASTMLESEHIESLETAGLVQVIRVLSQDELVVYPPILSDYFRAESGRWTLHGITSLEGPTQLLATAENDLAASSGQTALLSYRVREFWKQESFAREIVWRKDRSPASAARYLVALSHMGAPVSHILEVWRATSKQGPNIDRFVLNTWWACHLAIVQNRPEEGERLLEELRLELQEFDGALRAVQAHLTLATSRVVDPSLLNPAKRGEHQISFELINSVSAELYVAQGKPELALQANDRTENRSTIEIGWAENASRGMAMFLAGKVDEATDWAVKKYESSRTALDVSWSEGHAYMTALGLAMTGRLDAFDEHMSIVSSLVMPESINVHFLSATLTFASVLAGDRGMKESAVAYAEQAADLNLGPDVYPGIPPKLALVLAAGDKNESAHEAWENAKQRMAAGYINSAIMVGMIALEYDPDRGHARQIVEWVTQAQSPLLERVAEYAEVLADPTPHRFMRVSRRLAELGLMLYAMRAGVRAATGYYFAGQLSAAVEAADEVWSWQNARDLSIGRMFEPLVLATGITEREKEIMALVATGKTPAEIAEVLVLSVRTIEQHIHRATRKLGVSGRDSLVEIAMTWMAAFMPATPRGGSLE